MAHMGHSTVTSKGQVTLPAALREKFAVKAGDRVEFFEGQDGTLKMRVRARPADAVVGLLAHLTPDFAFASDEGAIAAEVASRDARSTEPTGPEQKSGKKGRAA